MDSIIYEESIDNEITSSEFVQRDWLYVNDNNNGSYSSQIVLDTTSISNSGSYINWSEAFILMPLVLQVESTSANLSATAQFDYLVALKSGYWNLLHSMSVEFNNGSVVQQVPFLNVFCGFKNITSWSFEDLKNWGAITGFRPDSALSWCFQATVPANAAGSLSHAQTGGLGLSNNRNAPYVQISAVVALTGLYNTRTQATLGSNELRSFWNDGLFERQLDINYQPATGVTTSGKGNFLGASNCSTIFRSFVNRAANIRSISIDAVIRLKDVCDFFAKCPLLKGSTMRIYLNTNQCAYQVTMKGGLYADATGVENALGCMALTSNPIVLGGGSTNPCMLASCDLGQGSYGLVPLASDAGNASTAVVNVALSIVRTQFSQVGGVALTQLSAPITSVRLYAPAYVFSPQAEQRYLNLLSTKKIVYNDIFQFQFQVTSNQNFNILVTNGIPNIKSVTILSFLPQASNGLAGGAYIGGNVNSDSLLSPFSSSPSSPDPLSITNFQVQLSGKNMFINQLQYDYENFVENLVSSNQLNGSLTTSMGSGLVSKRDFQYLYRYYYADCSRSIPGEVGVSKSIQLLGLIPTPTNIAVNLMVFVELEKSLKIDVRNGQRVG